MTIDRRTFVKIAAGGVLGSAAVASAPTAVSKARALYVRATRPRIGPPIENPPGQETLYNGVVLPSPWPPYRQQLEQDVEFPPYLEHPPDVIPIDVGRQLFVDDFLIEECELDRSYHAASYVAGNPIFKPEVPWERYDERERVGQPGRPTAMPFSDGVWFDPADRQFKMWYTGGYSGRTCYAVSEDGATWRRPVLDVVPGTNIVFDQLRDSSTVWLDHRERNPQLRFKMMVYVENGRRLRRYCSPDGIHWHAAGFGGPSGDRSTFFFNAFRNVWVYSVRDDPDLLRFAGRHRRYVEAKEFCTLTPWTADEMVAWVAADELDRPRVDLGYVPELYNLDCVAYESVLLGLFTFFYGDPPKRHKPNQVHVGFSRDGFYWARPSREPFIGVSERPGDWNWTNVQSAGGCCVVVGDRLYFYVSGRSGIPGSGDAGVCTTGLATLRRDGFVSLDAPADRTARRPGLPARLRSITTRPLRFSGSRLFVNAEIDNGELRAEVLDKDGHVVPSFTAQRCEPVRQDSTRAELTWSGASLSDLANQVVRLRFYLDGGRFYSFWIAATARGESNGYVAAGGPGFGGPLDTEGG
jgi:hypothetical protein